METSTTIVIDIGQKTELSEEPSGYAASTGTGNKGGLVQLGGSPPPPGTPPLLPGCIGIQIRRNRGVRPIQTYIHFLPSLDVNTAWEEGGVPGGGVPV